MTDESIINLSDETKSSLRIYATMAGFFVIASVMLYGIVAALSGLMETTSPVKYAGFVLLMIIGVVLAMLHKRDLFAAFFITFAFAEIINSMGPHGLDIPVAIIYLIFSLAILQTRNEQRFIVVGLLLLRAVATVMLYAQQFFAAQCFFGIITIACFYFAFALACEKVKLPLRDYLVADEEVPENDGVPVHFKEMGSSIGYAMIALPALTALLSEIGICDVLGKAAFDNLELTVGIILIFTGVIMMVAGRMKGTPFYFICAGFLFFMRFTGFSYVEGICAIILGIMVMVRSDSRILLGLCFILDGICNFIFLANIHEAPITCTMSALMFVILTYLIFAVNSNGKLKLI